MPTRSPESYQHVTCKALREQLPHTGLVPLGEQEEFEGRLSEQIKQHGRYVLESCRQPLGVGPLPLGTPSLSALTTQTAGRKFPDADGAAASSSSCKTARLGVNTASINAV